MTISSGTIALNISSVGWTLAELGRLLYTHGLAPTLVAKAVGLDQNDVARLMIGEGLSLDALADGARAAFVLNVLVRVEVRCCHDTVAIRAALERSLAELGGASISERLSGCTEPEDLAVLRLAAGMKPIPKMSMWRVADRYS
ncbi:hypothetical protein [uncultured Sphingomonas sp.]|uniref:hypothetical protein n=1 Tax=uncultured Sphingomonas sp. TaxID=158754 RepID=UPI0035C99CEB